METITEPVTDSSTDRYGIPKYAGQTMTKADFLRWESDDNYVYEFNNGVLEPTISMRQDETLLLRQLTRRFVQTEAYNKRDELVAEVNVWFFEKQMRRPDVAYYTADQLDLMANGESVVPGFAIEFVSENDDVRKYIRKLNEFFHAGVQVVWLVFPDDYTVYVYTSPKTVIICTDDDVLSAAPALPDLQMTVAELFRR